jgi:LysR family nitrogen assimilation transcriptional regulator
MSVIQSVILAMLARHCNVMSAQADMHLRHTMPNLERRPDPAQTMDFKQLETFVQVAQLGSFTRAASVLRSAQPALSRQVRALEVELRQHLFHRNGRGVQLTDAGQRLLAHGQGILQQLQRARQELEAQRGAPIGALAIGLAPSVDRVFTPSLVRAFRERFPKASLSVSEGLSAALLQALAQGRIDLAVVYEAPPSAAWHVQPVLQEPLLLVSAAGATVRQRPSTPRRAAASKTPAARRVPLPELADLDLVMPSRPHSIRMRVETALAAQGLAPRIAMQVDSISAILELVAQQPGWHAVLTQHALQASGRPQAFLARPIAPAARGSKALTVQLAIATSAQRPSSPLLEQCTELLRGLMATHLAPAASTRQGPTAGTQNSA